MGMFDSLLTAIAPERAVKRAAAQSAIRAINSGYSNYGASLHKKSMRGWTWHGGSPKEDIEDNLRVLRERSRDAFMGVPLATGAIKTMRTNVVCGGLTPTPQIDNAFLGISDEEAQKINAQIAREFSLWANKPTCDADRLDNFYMLQQLMFTGFLLNGDAVAVLQNKKSPGVLYDLRLRIIEADRLCSPSFMDVLSPCEINGRHVEKIVQGVETDAEGMVVAYWICDRHPLASTVAAGLSASHWTRVEAYGAKTGRQNILCLMQRDRAGQVRGVPLLAPVLESLKQLGRFTDAELTAAVVSAMFTVFIKKTDQSDEVPFGEVIPPEVQVDAPDKTSVELAPGAFIDLNPGEDVQFADPKHPTTGFEAFMNAIVKQMAAALEIPSEVLYKQFSTSYSAARGALNEFWRTTGIKKGLFLNLTQEELPRHGKHKQAYKKVCKKEAARAPAGESIEQRPTEVNERQEFGHWEGDTVYSGKGKVKTTCALFTMTERKTRNEIIIGVPNRKAETIVKAVDALERKLGARKFRLIFKSITFDNGTEFAAADMLERSCINKTIPRTKVYFCHPYSSWERGSNEHVNGMIRRKHPKGTDFSKVSKEQLAATEKWVNEYPRKIFGYKSSAIMFQQCLNELGIAM